MATHDKLLFELPYIQNSNADFATLMSCSAAQTALTEERTPFENLEEMKRHKDETAQLITDLKANLVQRKNFYEPTPS